jgi:hypothetical protein
LAHRCPASILTRVDLPAPFWPRSAWISPPLTARSTRSSARVPGNRLTIPITSRSGFIAPASDRYSRSDPPDLEVAPLIVVVWNEDVLGVARLIHVVTSDEVGRLNEAAWRGHVEGSIEFIDCLIGLQLDRLRNCNRLILVTLSNPSVGGAISICTDEFGLVGIDPGSSFVLTQRFIWIRRVAGFSFVSID